MVPSWEFIESIMLAGHVCLGLLGDPNLHGGEACDNPEFQYDLITDPISSSMKWVTYRRVGGGFRITQAGNSIERSEIGNKRNYLLEN